MRAPGSASAADLIEMLEQVGRVLEHAIGPCAREFAGRRASRQESDAERSRARRREHVPDRVADHGRLCDRHAESTGSRHEQVGVGLRAPYLVTRDDRHARGVDAEHLEHGSGGFDAPARRDRPRAAGGVELCEQFACTRQRADLRCARAVRLCMPHAQALRARIVEFDAALAQQDVRHQAAAHADAPVDAPHRQFDAFAGQRFVPGECMLVDAVDEGAIEVEQERGLQRIVHRLSRNARRDAPAARPRYPMPMAMYRFDDFLLNPATRELHERGELVALPARAFDCLSYLVEHRDRAVGRDELIAAVWGRVEVSEALLSHTIVKLRRSLGDTGSEQRLIRTVPRFGYRWTGAIVPIKSALVESALVESAVVESAVEPAPGASAIDAPTALAPAASSAAATASQAARRGARSLAGAGALIALALLLALAWWWRPRAHDAPPAVAASPRANAALAAPALVLPAEIDAPEDWRWLRLGLMDLVATRLRAGALPTMSSESVVALLRTRDPAAPDALHDATLAQVAALRVQPRVRLADAGWEVRLDAFGAQRELDVTARHADPVVAAREAADRLLHELGRTPGAGEQAVPPELEHLLQHSGAAMLADQLDEARALIDAAPAALQQAPRAQQRLAQIDLRRGDYPAVEQRLHALLDGLDPARESALRARVLITLAAALVRKDQPARAGELYEEAIELRRDAGDHEALGVALLGRGVVLAQAGRIDEALGELARARIELETVGDSLGVASVDVNVGDFQLMRHRPADALAMLVEAADAFARLGAREGLAHALAQQVAAQLERVDPAAALAASERAWPPESHTSNLRMRWRLVLARAEALAAAGQASAARELLAEVRDAADPRRDAGVRAGAQALAARLAWAQGDAGTAREAAEAALLPALQAAAPIAHARTRLVHLRALRAAGERARAAEEVRSLRESAGTDEWLAMQADLAEAEQAWSEGRREPALERFERAWQYAGRAGTARDLVDVAAAYVAVLIDASQLDTARAVGGRIARWVDVDWHAADAMAKLYRAIGEHAAAHKSEQARARLAPN